jgi:hypothetical protein
VPLFKRLAYEYFTPFTQKAYTKSLTAPYDK